MNMGVDWMPSVGNMAALPVPAMLTLGHFW